MQALVTGVVEEGNPLGLWKYYRRESAWERRGYGNTTEGNPLGSGGAMEILQKGIRWGAAGLWKYYRRESAGERRGYGNTTEGNPLGSGGAMEILQKGIRWGAVTGMGLEVAGEP